MCDEINHQNEEMIGDLMKETADGVNENRRSFLRRSAVGICAALLAPFFLTIDRFGRNLSEAQATDIANRIVSRGLKPLVGCVGGYCTAPNTFCSSDNCTTPDSNTCLLLHGSCTSDYCGSNYCWNFFCDNQYSCGAPNKYSSCQSEYCNPANNWCNTSGGYYSC